MKFIPTPISDVYVVQLEKHTDNRGFFARSWCVDEFKKHGLNPALVQCNVSHNTKRGTLRGLHYQAAPHEEAKLVRVTRGAIWDVVVDLRKNSPTYKKWHAVELNEDNGDALYIPEGVAHGFQSLRDNTDVLYHMSTFYAPASARGIKYDDAELNIAWPIKDVIISDRDREFGSIKDL